MEAPDLWQGKNLGGGCVCACVHGGDGSEGSWVAVGHAQGGGSSHKVVPAAPGLRANPGCAPACHSGKAAIISGKTFLKVFSLNSDHMPFRGREGGVRRVMGPTLLSCPAALLRDKEPDYWT